MIPSPLVAARTSAASDHPVPSRPPLDERAAGSTATGRHHPGAVVSVGIVRGREAVLNLQPKLAALAEDTEQAGEADSLSYFLANPVPSYKSHHVLVMTAADGSLAAAVLLFEYRARLGGTRVFATADASGRRTVLAPPELRARTAALAARTLITRGAHLVHLAFSEVHQDSDRMRNPVTGATPLAESRGGTAGQAIATELRGASGMPHAEWALLEREVPAYLPLLGTLDATLARIGTKTRANLRYYRRRAEADLGAVYIPQVSIGLAEFLAFNRSCTYAVADEVARFRHQAIYTLPNQRMVGVRDRNGNWLALMGGRRKNGFVELDWQMNRADLPAYSLATVLRAFVIEHEIAQGSTRFYMEGGTPQPIGRSFLKHRICELTVKRRSRYVSLLERFAPFVFPPKNYIGQTLLNPELLWRPV